MTNETTDATHAVTHLPQVNTFVPKRLHVFETDASLTIQGRDHAGWLLFGGLSLIAAVYAGIVLAWVHWETGQLQTGDTTFVFWSWLALQLGAALWALCVASRRLDAVLFADTPKLHITASWFGSQPLTRELCTQQLVFIAGQASQTETLAEPSEGLAGWLSPVAALAWPIWGILDARLGKKTHKIHHIPAVLACPANETGMQNNQHLTLVLPCQDAAGVEQAVDALQRFQTQHHVQLGTVNA